MVKFNSAYISPEVLRFKTHHREVARIPMVGCSGFYTAFYTPQTKTTPSNSLHNYTDFGVEGDHTTPDPLAERTRELIELSDKLLADALSGVPHSILSLSSNGYTSSPNEERPRISGQGEGDWYEISPDTGEIINPLFSGPTLESHGAEAVVAFHTRVLESIRKIRANSGPNADMAYFERSIAYHHEKRAEARGVLLPVTHFQGAS